MFVCCECCVLSGRGLCDALITRPEESCRLWCVVVCDQETSGMNRPWPALGRNATEKKIAKITYEYPECPKSQKLYSPPAPLSPFQLPSSIHLSLMNFVLQSVLLFFSGHFPRRLRNKILSFSTKYSCADGRIKIWRFSHFSGSSSVPIFRLLFPKTSENLHILTLLSARGKFHRILWPRLLQDLNPVGLFLF